MSSRSCENPVILFVTTHRMAAGMSIILRPFPTREQFKRPRCLTLLALPRGRRCLCLKTL